MSRFLYLERNKALSVFDVCAAVFLRGTVKAAAEDTGKTAKALQGIRVKVDFRGQKSLQELMSLI